MTIIRTTRFIFHLIMIRVEGLKYSYGQNSIVYPDFQVLEGNNFAIVGNSGSGKTTLLHLISGLRQCQEGSIFINETDISTLAVRELDQFRGKKIGLIFQQAHLLSALTVQDNLLAGQFFAGVDQRMDRVKEVIDELNLTGKANSKPHQLSQGEAQRVAIARAVLNKPSVIMADEPTSSLDDENCSKVLNMLIDEAHQYNASLIVVTHDQRVKERITDGINLSQK